MFPPITTPFVEGTEDVDHAALAHNVQRYARKEVPYMAIWWYSRP